MSKAFAPLLILFSLLIAFSVACTTFVRYGENILLAHPKWTLKKRTFALDLVGASEALLTRGLIAGYVFRPGAWYGFQEIDTRDSFKPFSVKFGFRLQYENSNVSVLLGESAEGFAGVRLSRHLDIPSLAFVAANDGSFLLKQPLPDLQIDDDKWHSVELRFADGVSLLLDDKEPLTVLPASVRTEGKIGFRGGFTFARIRSIEIRDQRGGGLKENFNPNGFLVRLLLAHWFVGLALAGAFMAPGLRRKKSLRDVCLPACAALFVLTSVVSAVAVVDRFTLSVEKISAFGLVVPHNRFVTKKVNFLRAVEVARFWTLDTWYGFLTGVHYSPESILQAGYPPLLNTPWGSALYCASEREACRQLSSIELAPVLAKPKTAKRIMFVGTSQTFGSGAPGIEETFFALTTRLIQKASHRPLEALNISKVGGMGPEIWATYQNTYATFRPDLVVVNLSHNDDSSSLNRVVKKILEANQEAHIRTILLTEAVSFDSYKSPLTDGLRIDATGAVMTGQEQMNGKHLSLRELGREFSVPVLPLQEYLNSPAVRDEGFLWWDSVHMSAAGQSKVAAWLAPQLTPLLFPRAR